MMELTDVYYEITGTYTENGKWKTKDLFHEVGLMEDAILDGEQALDVAYEELNELRSANEELEDLLAEAQRDIELLEDKLDV
jgi:chromosome segregation ATPase